MPTLLAARLAFATAMLVMVAPGSALGDWLPYCFMEDGSKVPCGGGPIILPPAPPPIPQHVQCNGGQCTPDDGYTWRNAKPGDLEVRWDPGRSSSRYGEHVIAGAEPGHWRPDEGYDWASKDSNDYRVIWIPGQGNKRHPNVHASNTERQWIPNDGYRFVGRYRFVYSNSSDSDFRTERDPRFDLSRRLQELDRLIAEQDRALNETLRQIRARSHEIWDAERILNEWVRADEHAKARAYDTAMRNLWGVTTEAAKWLSPLAVKKMGLDKTKRVETILTRYMKQIGRDFRKIEVNNPRFLRAAYRAITSHYARNRTFYTQASKLPGEGYKSLKSAAEADKAIGEHEYVEAAAATIEAFNSLYPTKFSPLISMTVSADEIWTDNIYAFWVGIDARARVKELSNLQDSDLRAIKTLSNRYKEQMKQKNALKDQRTDVSTRLSHE